MSRKWNGKAIVDELATRLWDVSDANKERIITWVNEIQDDIVSEMPIDFFKFKLKKLMPTQQDIIEMSPEVPIASNSAIDAGGSLTHDANYKAVVTFVIWDADQKDYIESEPSPVSDEVTADSGSGDQTLVLSDVPLFGGTSTVTPTLVWRRVYLMQQLTGGSYGEPLFVGDIEDNTTTDYTITDPTTSTISPPSDSEVDQLASDNLYNIGSGKFLERQDMDDLRRFNPTGSENVNPSYYDYVGSHKVKLYPKLSATATDAQRTMNYFVLRRPHEVFYDVDRAVDLPITFKKALIEGVLWKGYEFRDRDGHVSKLNNYEEFKKQALNKIRRLKNRPSVVRDVSGDTYGYEV